MHVYVCVCMLCMCMCVCCETLVPQTPLRHHSRDACTCSDVDLVVSMYNSLRLLDGTLARRIAPKDAASKLASRGVSERAAQTGDTLPTSLLLAIPDPRQALAMDLGRLLQECFGVVEGSAGPNCRPAHVRSSLLLRRQCHSGNLARRLLEGSSLPLISPVIILV